MLQNLIESVHPEWQPILHQALLSVDQDYFNTLEQQNDWLPGPNALFAAFSMPLSQTRYILLGESPYPRQESANGYAFWDNAVGSLWSPTGLSKPVNRATSLRNLIKMLLLARGDLHDDFSQEAIATLDTTRYVQTAADLFRGLMNKGFLLLNASLVYGEEKVRYHAKHWRPFIDNVLDQLTQCKSDIQLVILGEIAKKISKPALRSGLIAEHPYNISFITNPDVLAFFKPLDILQHDK